MLKPLLNQFTKTVSISNLKIIMMLSIVLMVCTKSYFGIWSLLFFGNIVYFIFYQLNKANPGFNRFLFKAFILFTNLLLLVSSLFTCLP